MRREARGVASPRIGAFIMNTDMSIIPPAQVPVFVLCGGLGTRLKLYQRELLLAAGVGEVRWTYDPLEARNANLNLNHLGVEVAEYVEDMYEGEMGSDLAKGIVHTVAAIREQQPDAVMVHVEATGLSRAAREDGPLPPAVLTGVVRDGLDHLNAIAARRTWTKVHCGAIRT